MANQDIRPPTGSLRTEGQPPGIRLSPLFVALLNSARHLIGNGEPTAAVLIAQTAIEVCTDRLITKLLLRDAQSLQVWIGRRVQSYNLARQDVTALYKAVTGDTTITDQDFWNRLNTHVTLRNQIAHRGRTATVDEAKTSLLVAEQIISHMTSVAASKSLDLGD